MAKNSKVGHFRGNNSYKGSPYNFIQMKTFDEEKKLLIKDDQCKCQKGLA
jgi:hypothetical protein